ncbi:MAG: hypothetical protein JST80_00285 [Bdellovibrionales bacterium]|nr:hypothetical protein [Bdellovibrionales bacterium]
MPRSDLNQSVASLLLCSFLTSPAHAMCDSNDWTVQPTVQKLSEMPFDRYVQKRWQLDIDEIDRRFAQIGEKPAGVSLAADLDPKMEYVNVWERDNGITARQIKERKLWLAYLDRAAARRLAAKVQKHDLSHALFNQKGDPLPWLSQGDGPAYRSLNENTEALYQLKLGQRQEALKYYNPVDGLIFKADGTFETKLKDGKDLNTAKQDADWLAEKSLKDTVDLWEEIGGIHFHTAMLDHAALENAYQMELRFSNNIETADAIKYRTAADKIKLYVRKNAWDAEGKYLKSTLTVNPKLGFRVKEPLDIAVIIGWLHTRNYIDPSRAIYSGTDDMMLATMATLESRFEQNYVINKQDFVTKKSNQGAVFLGRYTWDPFHGGNSWALANYIAAQFYTVDAELILGGAPVKINAINRGFFARLLGVELTNPKIAVGTPVQNGFRNEVVNAMKKKGEAYLRLMQRVTPDDGIFHEQIARGYVPDDKGYPWADEYRKLIGLAWDKSHVPVVDKDLPIMLGARNLLWNNYEEEVSFEDIARLNRKMQNRAELEQKAKQRRH